MESGRWLSNLSSLQNLNLAFVDLSEAPDTLESLNGLQSLSVLDLSSSHLSDIITIPPWLFQLTGLQYLDLSGNLLDNKTSLVLASIGNLTSLRVLDLSNNGFIAEIPTSLGNHCELRELYFFYNFFGGNFSDLGATVMSGCIKDSLETLSWSGGNLTGQLPDWLGGIKNLKDLHLSSNSFYGQLPDWLGDIKNLENIDLGNNNLSGGIPTTTCSNHGFHSLHLNDNGLSGELPLTLINCTRFKILDLARNKFSGSIPAWIGESFTVLTCLRLRSNLFVGNIPPQLGNLQYLQVIDLAHNDLSGTIPHSFGNLSAMKFSYHRNYSYEDVIEVYMKGREERYDRLLPYLSSMDLAGNNLTGEIPEELTTLIGLQNLNLSGNHLTGKIPKNISELQWLESLDLSINNLSGAIPKSMIAMHSLDVLNLSFNNFFGKIPYGGQLQALPDPSIYIGNHELCGFPLNTKCQYDGTSQPQQMVKNDESDSEIEGFYLSMGVGFAVGLWTIFGILLINKRWRIAYFQFFDNMYDKIYVALAISMARMNN